MLPLLRLCRSRILSVAALLALCVLVGPAPVEPTGGSLDGGTHPGGAAATSMAGVTPDGIRTDGVFKADSGSDEQAVVPDAESDGDGALPLTAARWARFSPAHPARPAPVAIRAHAAGPLFPTGPPPAG